MPGPSPSLLAAGDAAAAAGWAGVSVPPAWLREEAVELTHALVATLHELQVWGLGFEV